MPAARGSRGFVRVFRSDGTDLTYVHGTVTLGRKRHTTEAVAVAGMEANQVQVSKRGCKNRFERTGGVITGKLAAVRNGKHRRGTLRELRNPWAS